MCVCVVPCVFPPKLRWVLIKKRGKVLKSTARVCGWGVERKMVEINSCGFLFFSDEKVAKNNAKYEKREGESAKKINETKEKGSEKEKRK